MTRLRGSLALLLLPCVLAACAGQSRKLTYAQVQALNPGIPASWILEEYPGGRATNRPNGVPETITYAVTDPTGRGETLTLAFDECGILSQKSYSGRPVRPAQQAPPQPAPACPPCGPGQGPRPVTSRGGPPITNSTPSSQPSSPSSSRQR